VGEIVQVVLLILAGPTIVGTCTTLIALGHKTDLLDNTLLSVELDDDEESGGGR
jgi:hypothetical protein